MTMESNKKRVAVSDEGQRLLRAIHIYFTSFGAPTGLVELPTVLRAIEWGWVNQRGLTEAGYEALMESGYRPVGSDSKAVPDGPEKP